MVEDRTRHDRLRSLFPRGYATDPRDSALGVMLEVLADHIRESDRAVERGLRDKWLLTADGVRDPAPPSTGPGLPRIDLGDQPRPLEYLGAALDLLRQPWEVDAEAYRRRVKILAPLLAGGLGTARALASVALSSLGSEPCPVLERKGHETRGYGLPSGSLDRCRTCRSGQRVPPGTPCPLRAKATMSVSIVDNPRNRVVLRREQLRIRDDGGARVHLNNLSLFADRPELVLSVPEEAGAAAILPRFRSLTTGEEITVARVLGPGETLRLRGPSPYDPSTPPQRQQWVDRPAAFAAAPPQARVGTDVDIPVLVVQGGARFDLAVFGPDAGEDEAAARFSSNGVVSLGQLEVPSITPGANTWIYEPLVRAEFQALLDDLDPAFDPSGLPDPALLATTPDTSEVRLELRWWIRRPSRFGVRIPRTSAVQAAIEAGATEYLRRMIDRARPVGVLPIIDFLQPLEAEAHDVDDELVALDLGIREDADPRDLLAPQDIELTDALDPEDGGGFIGVFDVTVFDFSVFADLGVVPGRFDTTYYDFALFNELVVEPGSFDTSYFGFAEFQ